MSRIAQRPLVSRVGFTESGGVRLSLACMLAVPCAYVDPCPPIRGACACYFCLPTAAAAVLYSNLTTPSGDFCGFCRFWGSCFTTNICMPRWCKKGLKPPITQEFTRCPHPLPAPILETNNSTTSLSKYSRPPFFFSPVEST